MKITKRTRILIFILTVSLLFASLFFKSTITGYVAFSDRAFTYPVYDYLLLILIALIIISAIGIYTHARVEQEIQEELTTFNVDEPNTSFVNLEKYIDYCISQGRDEADIKEVLVKARWDNNLINEAFENLKAKA